MLAILTIYMETRLEHGLHMVVTAPYSCNNSRTFFLYVSKWVLLLLECRLQIFLVEDHYLESLPVVAKESSPVKFDVENYAGPEVTFSQHDCSKVECILFSCLCHSTFIKLNMICLQAFCLRLL